ERGLVHLGAVGRAVTAAEADLRVLGEVVHRRPARAASLGARSRAEGTAHHGAARLRFAARRSYVARSPFGQGPHAEHFETVLAVLRILRAGVVPRRSRRISEVLGAFAGALPFELRAEAAVAVGAHAHGGFARDAGERGLLRIVRIRETIDL